MKTNWIVLISIVLLLGLDTQAQKLDSLVKSASMSLTIKSGELVGPDIDRFKSLLDNTQFVSIAEEHEVKEVNLFSMALFNLLVEDFNYQYLALEQGPVLGDEINKRVQANDPSPVKNYARKYKRAFHFSSDEELDFLEKSISKSSVSNPFWGCNQEYGAEHVLHKLHDLADDQYKSRIQKLVEHAHEIEKNRKDNYPYMCCVEKPKDFHKLSEFSYSKDSAYAKILVEALLESQLIYDKQNKSSQINPTIYENNSIRENYMKRHFFDNYTSAVQQGNDLPKAMLKFGHWHLKNGLGPSGISTLGSFVSSLAFTNQKTNLTIGVFINNEQGKFRGYKKGSLREFLCNMIPKTDTYTIINTKPLRKFLYSKKIKNQVPEPLQESFREWIYSYDVLLLIRNASSVTWDLVYSTQ